MGAAVWENVNFAAKIFLHACSALPVAVFIRLPEAEWAFIVVTQGFRRTVCL
jgi:uncharacterized membrane protein YccC